MRPFLIFCAALMLAQPALAGNSCGVQVGGYALMEGDVESTSVVHGNSGQAILSKDANKTLEKMSAVAGVKPVHVQIGTYNGDLVLHDVLVDRALTIPGNSTSEGLVTQQALKRCL